MRPIRPPDWLWPLVLGLAACTPSPAVPAAAAVPAALVRAAVPSKAAALMDAAPAEVQAALGAPDLQRRDGPAVVWLYATAGGCRVDVVFYPQPDGPRVAHAAARTPPATGEAACLAMVAARP